MAKNEVLKAKTKTFQTLLLAMNETGITFAQIADELGVSSQSLTQSVRNKTVRLETLYQIELILKRKIVFSQFDNAVDAKTELLLAEIKIKDDFIKQLIAKIPSAESPQALALKKRTK